MGPEDIYTRLVNSAMNSLLEEAIIIGLFVVAFGYLRYAVSNPKILQESIFWKRAFLLGCVVMFVTYITITYEVDLQSHDDPAKAVVDESTIATARSLIIMMIPIDLLGIALMVFLFVALSLEELSGLLKRIERRIDLHFQIGLLFVITGIWHLVMVTWWIVYSSHTGNVADWLFDNWTTYTSHNFYDVVYHFLFASAHLLCFLLWIKLDDGHWHKTKVNALEWLGVMIYACLVLTVYISRLCTYAGKNYGKTSSPLIPFIMPAVILASVSLTLVIRKLRE